MSTQEPVPADEYGPWPSPALPAPGGVPGLPALGAWSEPPAVDEAAKPFTARVVLRAFRRHWWQILLLWVVGSGALLVLIHTKVKPTFDAQALLKVEPAQRGVFAPVNNWGGDNFAQYQKTQKELITSFQVLNTALSESPELRGLPLVSQAVDAEEEIRQNLSVNIIKDTSLIAVGMNSESPVEARQVVNAVVDAYIQVHQKKSREEMDEQIRRLEGELRTREAEAKTHQENVMDLASKLGTLDVESIRNSKKADIDKFKELSGQLTQVQMKLLQVQNDADFVRHAIAEAMPAAGPSGPAIEQQVRDAVEADTRVAQLDEQIQRTEQVQQNAASLARDADGDHAVRAAATRLNSLRQRRKKLVESLKVGVRRRLEAATAPGGASEEEHQLRLLEASVASLRQQETYLKGKLNKIEQVTRDNKDDSLKLEFARIKHGDAEAQAKAIRNLLDQLKFEQQSPARITVWQRAELPKMPRSDKKTRLMLVSMVGVFAGVLGLFVFLEVRSGRVADPDDLSSRARLKVIGVVPPLPALRAPRSRQEESRAHRQLQEFVQSVDHLRVALCAGRHPGVRDLRCVLITSACGSEGKTTLAAQLAGRCANAGLLTLLIDADLRNPSLSKLLDVPPGPGLADMLRGEVQPEAATVVIGDGGGFHLVPAGSLEYDPSRLLQGPRFGQLLAQFRTTFDLIIVDAPPVLPVPDALLLGRWIDGAVLAVRHDTSRFPLVKRAMQRLATVGVPVLGAVVNGLRTAESYYSSNYYAYRGAAPGDPVAPDADAGELMT